MSEDKYELTAAMLAALDAAGLMPEKKYYDTTEIIRKGVGDTTNLVAIMETRLGTTVTKVIFDRPKSEVTFVFHYDPSMAEEIDV